MNHNANASLGRPKSWWLWVGFWAVLFVIMHVPPPELAAHIGGADCAAHFAAYFILASLGAHYLRQSRRGTIIAALMGWAAIYLAYAAFDEWLQQFVRRTPDFRDWLADAGGVTVATVVAVVREWRSRARLSEPTGPSSHGNVTRS